MAGIDLVPFVEAIEQLNRRDVDFLISLDGKCGDKQYGEDLPSELGLHKVLLNAGLSSQTYPEEYTHVAGKEQRQIILTFTGDEIEDYMKLIELVGTDKAEETIKEMINKFVK